MADPLLTTLCAICHAQPPKYTCPACNTHTCSLPCTQRHKAWSACTGRRDPTAYKPIAQIKTPAGIDHDYNFLSAIERARERTQRDLLAGDAALFTPAQLGRDLDGERRWRREWFGEEVRFVRKGGGAEQRPAVVGSDGDEEGDGEERRTTAGGSFARKVRYRLDALDIEVVGMPVGMTRQRENTTAWNRRAGRINWCVEWFIYDCPPWPTGEEDNNNNDNKDENHHDREQRQQQQQPLRIRHKALETRPLHRALAESLAWHHKGPKPHDLDSDEDSDDDIIITAPARKRRRALIKELKDDLRRTTPQDPATTAFSHATPYATQNPYTGVWAPAVDRAATVVSWRGEELVARMRRAGWRFYLLRAPTPAGHARELIPCGAEEMLGSVLRGRTVVEFPTVYVLPPSVDGELPPGFVLGSTERRAKVVRGGKKKNNNNNKNNKQSQQQQQQQQQHPKKRKATEAAGARGGGGGDHGNDQKRQRGGLGARGGRGRGGRGGITIPSRRRGRADEEEQREEGEIASGDEEAAADTTSSDDADTSSSDEDEGVDLNIMRENATKQVSASLSLPPPPAAAALRHTGALVGYGSSSSDEEDEEPEEKDLASLKPEDPELVAGAIREIVGLLT